MRPTDIKTALTGLHREIVGSRSPRYFEQFAPEYLRRLVTLTMELADALAERPPAHQGHAAKAATGKKKRATKKPAGRVKALGQGRIV